MTDRRDPGARRRRRSLEDMLLDHLSDAGKVLWEMQTSTKEAARKVTLESIEGSIFLITLAVQNLREGLTSPSETKETK